jgi:hypothetical protein
LQSAVLVGVAILMDLSSIDTLWSQGLFPVPLHLLTVALIAAVIGLAWPGRAPLLWRLAKVG